MKRRSARVLIVTSVIAAFVLASPEQVGQLIADEYALLYESSPPVMSPAALLRAQAAAMRDASAEHPDWDAIGRLLRDSYRELRLALASANV